MANRIIIMIHNSKCTISTVIKMKFLIWRHKNDIKNAILIDLKFKKASIMIKTWVMIKITMMRISHLIITRKLSLLRKKIMILITHQLIYNKIKPVVTNIKALI